MPLSWNEIKSRALAFSRRWQDASEEKQQSIPFWIDFFEVFGITNRRVASFEHAVKKHGGGQGWVDLLWPGELLVEHKSRGKPLSPAFDQAMDYFPGLPERDLPHTLVLCDFASFRVIDLDSRREITFALQDLHQHVRWFGFIAGYRAQVITPQNPVNIRAAERMGRLHDALKASGYGGHALEVLLVRLLFCLFADDTAIFPAQGFRDLIEERTAADGSDTGARLAQFFQVLNTPEAQRSKNLDEQLAAFPYINGRLFAEMLPLAEFDAPTREALLDACALDWSAISPAIFGSLFQSIMDAGARRNLGAHYTSEENILKLIGPLFLDELRAEFARVKNQRNRLFEFHKKLRSLNFFDPACGCGNFLVISYRELRLLELQVLRAAAQLSGHAGQRSVDVHALIGVNVDQFHGIEIEEFPAQIAQVALWLVDHQMNLRVSEEFGLYFARIPLVTSPGIVHGNALALDWNEVLPAAQCSYVLGNPPFVGAKFLDDTQREDARAVFAGIDGAGLLDFVAAWYVKAARYLRSASDLLSNKELSALAGQGFEADFMRKAALPRAAFVSTNSITQGEQVGVLWGWLLAQGVHIQFAHRTFAWSNEARGKAAVHCVIVGFGLQDRPGKVIYEYADIRGEPQAVPAANINPYLIDGPDVVLARRSRPICDVPQISFGNQPIDGGHLVLTPEEAAELAAEAPELSPYVRLFLGAEEFINGGERYCLWLKDCPPSLFRRSKTVLARLEAVRRFRLDSKRQATRDLAATPSTFAFVSHVEGSFIVVPSVSSERRTFIPIGFSQPNLIVSNLCLAVYEASLFHFGILSSTMHNAWVRAVCGRLKSDYRYSAAIVYNNFPWPLCGLDSQAKTAETQYRQAMAAIEKEAKAVLDARAQFAGSSLADLYDPLTMPPALLRAHQRLDAAVDRAYQLAGGPKSYRNDAERVAFLFTLYQRITSLLPVAASRPARKRGAARTA
ncbi:N-6 DNA methylase [Melaminivora jejuensis]|uniref:class I SAM-dependent DNA methyltransferase n=1 Tax=Melaminivora jejuensis TaxID=1267217 RepID=UPI001ADFC364|nr:class I SAM-dependent DNA methyltransferase [Melaminivora jejuensis]UHJ65379.1 class I SAM-dependent DNA methyltransferase [Melaminivora jejuensis]